VKELGPSDAFRLLAAEGWLELGNAAEAEKELDQITRRARSRPEVLKARWCVCHAAKKWAAGVEVGSKLIELEPRDSFGWINRSYAIRRAPEGGLQAAYEALRPGAERVEDVELVAFNLACYACQLGRLNEARQWLKRAFAAAMQNGRLVECRRRALFEEDLRPLRDELDSLEN
jgi:tetratricopeptide (TPR) repeat protein